MTFHDISRDWCEAFIIFGGMLCVYFAYLLLRACYQRKLKVSMALSWVEFFLVIIFLAIPISHQMVKRCCH